MTKYKAVLRLNMALIKLIAVMRFVNHHRKQIFTKPSNLQKCTVQFIQSLATTIPKAKVLSILGISAYQLQSLSLPSCGVSLVGLCRRVHPHQLLQKEIEVLKQYLADTRFQYWSLASLYYKIIEDKAVLLSLSCFYRYMGLLGVARVRAKHRRKKHCLGIRAQKPGQLLHADTTVHTTATGQRLYIHVLQDNFSRFIYAIKVATACKAQNVLELILTAKANYPQVLNLPAVQLLTDNGSENAGELLSYLASVENENITQLIAQKDTPFSNSMIEACNKSLKYHFLYHQQIHTFEDLVLYAHKAVDDYNHRNMQALHGLTPHQVLHRGVFDKDAHLALTTSAQKQRVIVNRMTCCSW